MKNPITIGNSGGKMGAVFFMLMILFLAWLSNTGRLQAIISVFEAVPIPDKATSAVPGNTPTLPPINGTPTGGHVPPVHVPTVPPLPPLGPYVPTRIIPT